MKIARRIAAEIHFGAVKSAADSVIQQPLTRLEINAAVVGKKRRKSRSNVLGNHQKCWIWGRHTVLESVRAGRWLPLEIAFDSIVLEEHLQRELIELSELHQISSQDLSSPELERVCGAGDHQGVIAKMPPYSYADPEQVLKELHPGSAILILAGVQDPFNFGSILRSADLFGIEAVVVPTSGQATVSSHVARSSVGAVNYLEIAGVDNLAEFCGQLRQLGIQLVAATEKGNTAPAQSDFRKATAIIIGNESAGVPPELLGLCDAQLCIPMTGHVDSLNAAVAAGILCYELQRQRSQNAR